MKTNHTRNLIFAAFVQTWAAAALAGEPSDSLGTVLDLEAAEVVATRTIIENTSRQTFLGAQDIAGRQFGQDAPALLGCLPSVVAVSENGSGLGGASIRIRGTDATRINVTMNGMPLNDPDSHAMYWYDTPDILSATGGLQLIRGAGCSFAGTGSFGGAVALNTSALSTKRGGDASFCCGSFGTMRTSVHVGSGLLRGRWMFDLRLSDSKSDGYVDRGSTRMRSYFAQGGWFHGGTSLKLISFGGFTKTYLTYTGVTLEEMSLYGRRYHTSGQFVTPDGPYSLADGTRVDYFDDQTDNYAQSNTQLVLTVHPSPRWSLNLMGCYTFGYGWYRQYKDDARLEAYGGICEGRADLIRRKTMRNDRAGLNAVCIYEDQDFKLMAGASALGYVCPHWGTLDWIDGLGEDSYAGVEWYRNDVRKTDADAFAKARWRPLGRFELYADLQLRHVSYRAEGTNDSYDRTLGCMQPIDVRRRWLFFNPAFGARYSFAEHHSVEASFAVAHREPSRSDFIDRYMVSGLSEEPNSERLYDTELSYIFETGRLRACANLYNMYYRNQLVPTGIVNDSSDNLNVNVDRSYRRGVELDAGWKALSWLELDASATMSRNVIRDFTEVIDGREFALGDVQIACSPSLTAKASACIRFGKFEGTALWGYVGKQYFTNGNHEDLRLPAYSTTDLVLAYSLKRVRLSLKLANIFGREYCSFAYGGCWMEGDRRMSWAYYFPQPGRSAVGSISFRF